MTLHVHSLATAVPEVAIGAEQAAELLTGFADLGEAERRKVRALYRRSGIERRHAALLEPGADGPRLAVAPPGTTGERMERYACVAPELARAAARGALDRAGWSPAEVTHLVTVSCTGFVAPGFDVRLMKELPLPATTRRLHVGFMGCHGALNALGAADGLVARDPDARVLLCAVELCSLHAPSEWTPERVIPSTLFADGAAAVTLSGTPGDGPWTATGFGSVLFPESEEDMGWRIGDRGFEMTLSAEVPARIRAALGPWLAAWLDARGLSVRDVATWAVHPGGPRILDAVEDGLELARGTLDVSRDVLRTFGNMSSPTVLFLLERLAARGARGPCVALGFGPGLVAEAALLDGPRATA